MGSRRANGISLDSVRAVFDDAENPWTPLTASEVAAEVGCVRRTAHGKLQELAEAGDLRTKKVGARGRVWWRPPGADGPASGEDGPASGTTRTGVRFRTLVEAVEEYAIFMLDPDGHVVSWNSGAERIKGYDESEIVGQHFSEFYTPADRDAGVPEANVRAATERGRVEDEGWRLRADGTRFPANVVITAITDERGDVEGYAKVTRDMTEQREHERRLRREREKTEQVLRTSPVPIAVLDGDGHIVRANQHAQDLLGLSEQELLDHLDDEWALYDSAGDRLDPESTPSARVLRTGEPVYDEEVAVEPPDGERIWLSISAAPLFDDDAGLERIVVAGEDVTERRRQAMWLRQRSERLEAELDEIFSRISDGFYAVDSDWHVTHVNEAAERLLQRESSAVLGRDLREVFPEMVDTVVRERFREAMATQEATSFEAYHDRTDSWLETSVYPSESGLSIYLRDVTDRKERERELERYRTIVETVDDGVYTVDEDGRFTMVNAAYAGMLERSREELVGSHVSTVVDEAVIEEAREHQRKLVDGEAESAKLTTEIEVDDDASFVAEATFAMMTAAAGGPERVAVVRDVTERRERERELELYETIVSAVEDGVYVLDEAFRFAMVNEAYVEMTGYDREELVGSHCTLVISEDVSEESARLLEEVAAGDGGSAALEADIHRADGTTLRAESNFTALPSADGPPRKVGVVRDVSERVERERELARQRERLAALDDLNGVVRDITDAVIDRSTREEIEETVCERLAASDSYSFAWTGAVDDDSRTVTLRAEAGVEGYLDDITVSVNPDDERSTGPTGRAVLDGETVVTRSVRASDDHQPWRDHVERYGFESSAAIPISHDGTLYGVLNVYADRPHAFDEAECEVVSQLGEVVGHAIAAVERKRALMSDEVTELRFRVRDVFGALDLPVSTDGRIRFENTVHVGDGVYQTYGTVTADAIDALEALAARLSGREAVTIRDAGDGPASFEFRIEDPPVVSAVAANGGYLEGTVVEDGEMRMTVHLSPEVEARRIIDVVEAEYPDATMVARRQVPRSADTADRVGRAFTDGLTDRQRAALDVAYHSGFFEWPRETTGQDAAASLGVSSPTFHHHLRKAEKKLLSALYDSPAPA